MTFFKIVYMLSGKYRSTYIAKILSWSNEIINIRDIEGKEHHLKEAYIKQIVSIKKGELNQPNKTVETEQQTLF